MLLWNRRAFLGAALSVPRLRAQNFMEVKPSPQQIDWQDLEIGVLIHFGTNTFLDREWGDGKADPKVFNPSALEADQWVRAAAAAGARYLVMVAKHHDGFCLWPSRHTDYSVKSSPWRNGKGDLVREVEQACRKHGLKFGVYLSPWDRHDARYADNAAYDDYYVKQMNELITRYGELVEWWLDGAGSEGHVYDFERYLRELRTYQPNTMVFADVGFLKYGDIRWVGNESGEANETNWNVIDRLGYLRYRPAEADTPLREGHWFWHPNAEAKLKPLPKLMDIYHRTVGRGAQLVLGLAPDNRGLIPEVDVKRLEEFGAEVRRLYGHPFTYEHQQRYADQDPYTFHTLDANAGMIALPFRDPVTFDRALTMEWLNDGQKVQRYGIRAWTADGWRWLTEGTTIGHKKIDIFPRTTAREVQLHIRSSAGQAAIREFQVFAARA